VAVHGLLSLVKKGTNFPFIIVAPQCAEARIWEHEPLLQLLDQVAAKYAVDPKRVYRTGLSMGGYGTWKLGLQHPGRFAVLVPICGGGNLIDAVLGPRDGRPNSSTCRSGPFTARKTTSCPCPNRSAWWPG